MGYYNLYKHTQTWHGKEHDQVEASLHNQCTRHGDEWYGRIGDRQCKTARVVATWQSQTKRVFRLVVVDQQQLRLNSSITATLSGARSKASCGVLLEDVAGR